MLKSITRALSVCLVTSSALAAHAQIYKLHNVDLGVNATSPFTTTLTSNAPGKIQGTTDTVGFLFSLKEHPVSWAGIELNYGYNKYSQRFSGPYGTAKVKSYNHEATAAYILHPHFRRLQPFVAVGGGAIDFYPQQNTGPNQWRAAGLLETGLDLPTRNPHLGFRVQGRALVYRAPNFGNSVISTHSWVATTEPSAGVYWRF